MSYEILHPNGRPNARAQKEYESLRDKSESGSVLRPNGRTHSEKTARLQYFEGLKEGEKAQSRKEWRQGYKDTHDKQARKPPTHKD